jgi:hypothetical protein
LSEEEKKKLVALGSDLHKVWTAPTTTDRDRKELLHDQLEEVMVRVDRPERRGHLTLRWRGGTLTEIDVALPRMKPRGLHTDEDTIALLRRLAVHYSDDVISSILNRHRRKTATGERFTANQVGSLRRYRNIPRYEPPAEPPTGDVVPIRKAVEMLGVYTSTIHRWLNDGFMAGEQVTPGAPWRIRMTDELRARFVEHAPPGNLPMLEATMKLVSCLRKSLVLWRRPWYAAPHVKDAPSQTDTVDGRRTSHVGPLGAAPDFGATAGAAISHRAGVR